MPEGIEIEIYRQAAEQTVGRTVKTVSAPDPWYLKDGLEAQELVAMLGGRTITGMRRRGKLMIVDFDDEKDDPIRLGLRFGMTGRLIVDGVAAIKHLEYASRRSDPSWVRFALGFEGGGDLFIHDPRRLGAVVLDPNEDALGVDMGSISLDQCQSRIFVGHVALKARLLDQARISGVGNLIADEALWRAGIDPARPAGSLTPQEQEHFCKVLRSTVADLTAQGGSHTGTLYESRVRGGLCPSDGAELARRQVGGRTTYSCPAHQR